MEYKSSPTFVKSIEDRTVTGIFCVHGVLDSYSDISHPGSFSKTIPERGSKVKHLWNHDLWAGPPIAKITNLREVTRDELPEELLAKFPEATGGGEVTRKYLDTPRAGEVLEAIKEGAVDEMSYGYDPVSFDFKEIDGALVRNLREVRLWETSDTLWGANPATAASKFLMPIEMLVKQIEGHLANKAGARHSATDTKLLNAIHKAALELGATNCKGIAEEEEEPNTEEGKSRAGAADNLPLVAGGPPLTLLREKLAILELQLS